MNKKMILGHLMAFLTIAIWGITFVSTKVLLDFLSPIEILVSRFLMAYILLFVLYPKVMKIKSLKEEILFFFLGLFGICSYYLLENIALKYTLVSNVGFYMSATPIITSLIVTIVLKQEAFRKKLVTGSIIAFTGVYIIMFNGKLYFQIHPIGDVLALSAAFSFSVYTILLRKLNKKHNYLLITRKIFFYGLICMIPIYFKDFEQISLSKLLIPKVYLNLLFLGIMASSLCFFMWNKSVAIIGAIKASNYIYLVPIITAGSSILILSEKLTIPILLGGFLILLGAVFSEKGFNMFKLFKMIKRKDEMK
jgi:drug/metabolite transporter (DMT)-like permease